MKHHRLNHRSSEARLRAAIEAPRIVRFWGADHHVTHRLVTKIFGNGRRLFYVQPLNTRPNYYAIRIDSRWVDLDGYGFRDFLEFEVYEAIEGEFGRARYDGCDDDGNEIKPDPWPAFDDEYGCMWGELYWPWPLKRGKVRV